jgi:hypothetical protein
MPYIIWLDQFSAYHFFWCFSFQYTVILFKEPRADAMKQPVLEVSA